MPARPFACHVQHDEPFIHSRLYTLSDPKMEHINASSNIYVVHTFMCGLPDDEFRATAAVDTTDVHMSSVLSISSWVGRGLSEHGDCSRDVESRSSSLKGRPDVVVVSVCVCVLGERKTRFVSIVHFDLLSTKGRWTRFSICFQLHIHIAHKYIGIYLCWPSTIHHPSALDRRPNRNRASSV